MTGNHFWITICLQWHKYISKNGKNIAWRADQWKLSTIACFGIRMELVTSMHRDWHRFRRCVLGTFAQGKLASKHLVSLI
jgi:hypothetical protein